MANSPEPNRTWFVYFKEKEMGPFPELVLLEKLKSGELDQSAFLFTEGMPDWALVKDIPVIFSQIGVQQKSATPTSQNTQTGVRPPAGSSSDPSGEPSLKAGGFGGSSGTKTQVSQASASKAAKSPFPTTQSSAKIDLSGSVASENKANAQTQAMGAMPSPQETQGSKPKQKFSFTGKLNFKFTKQQSLILLLAVLAAFAAVVLPGIIAPPSDNGEVEIEGFTNGENSPQVQSNSASAPAGSNSMPEGNRAAQIPPSGQNGDLVQTPNPSGPSIDWALLKTFRESRDPKSAPYRLLDSPLGSDRPLVIGVLNSQIEAEWVSAAVYPDNAKNLMAVPQIWYLRTGVQDGFFVLGPLSHKGENLPPGRYKVMIQAGDKFLGETGFEFGTWPDIKTVGEFQAKFAEERKQLALGERVALEARVKELISFFDQLKTRGVAATRGKKGAKEWANFSRSWIAGLRKSMNDHQSVLRGPMFFGDVQQEAFSFANQLKYLFESYQIVSEKGPKVLLKLRKKDLGRQISDLSKSQLKLEEKSKALATIVPKPFELDGVSVKLGLKNFAQAGSR